MKDLLGKWKPWHEHERQLHIKVQNILSTKHTVLTVEDQPRLAHPLHKIFHCLAPLFRKSRVTIPSDPQLCCQLSNIGLRDRFLVLIICVKIRLGQLSWHLRDARTLGLTQPPQEDLMHVLD